MSFILSQYYDTSYGNTVGRLTSTIYVFLICFPFSLFDTSCWCCSTRLFTEKNFTAVKMVSFIRFHPNNHLSKGETSLDNE